VTDPEISERLEMLVVARWLDDGRPDDGAVLLPVVEASPNSTWRWDARDC